MMMTSPSPLVAADWSVSFPRPLWTPVPGVYSPPWEVPGMQCTIYWMRDDAPERAMGVFIGSKGLHFKNITALSGAAYLFLRKQDGRYFVEIWGYPGTEFPAMEALWYHWNVNVLPSVGVVN
jgi:hypothetical protein